MPSIAQYEKKRPPTPSEASSSQPGKAGRKTVEGKAPAPPPPRAAGEETEKGGEEDNKDDKEETNQPTKKKRPKANAKNAETDEIIKILPSLARLTLQNTQKLRAVDSLLLDTYLIKTASLTVSKLKENTQKYAEIVAEVKKQKGDLSEIGPPHLVAFEGLLEGAAAHLSEKASATAAAAAGPEATITEQLKIALTKWRTLTQPEANDIVPYCRASATYKPETTKIQLNIRDPVMKKLVSDAMARNGAQKKVGQAAPGALERIVQKALD